MKACCLTWLCAALLGSMSHSAASFEKDAGGPTRRDCPIPPPPTAEQIARLKTHLNSHVLTASKAHVRVGVDVLGRMAIAIDTNADSVSDQLLLYTDQHRLQGPWSKELHDAAVIIREGSILITSRSQSFGISLAVSKADQPAMPARIKTALVHGPGRELVRLFDERGIAAMGSLDHNSVHSWPESFWNDSLLDLQQQSEFGH